MKTKEIPPVPRCKDCGETVIFFHNCPKKGKK